MDKIRILWADDEIDLLKPHIMFLEQKGYELVAVNNGDEALDIVRAEAFDIIFLDENMPGLSGIETLEKIKAEFPNLPVVMITKSEEESIMEDAIGSNIADYLIKPVKPNQILLSLKRNLENRKLVSEKSTMSYQQEFRNIGMELNNQLNFKEWTEVFKKLTRWELELERTEDEGIKEVLNMQKDEANTQFSKFIEKNYIDWLNRNPDDKPVLSHTLIRDKLMPVLERNERPVFLLVIDNLRYDQWKVIQPLIEQSFRVETDEIYCSILPTTTQYARNALFAGLMPNEIRKKYPQYWNDEEDEGTKNQFESELLNEQLKRFGKDIRFSYNKILNLNAGKRLAENMSNLMSNQLNVIVYNFIDMLSHARTDMQMIRELAEDESAYRSLMKSWFEHSSLFEILRFIAQKKSEVILTTDHGSVYVKDPVKILGDRNVNTNLRYKYGKSLKYNAKEVFEVRNPEDVFLPRINVSTAYVFARSGDFFAYPNNYNHYVNYYRNTFQHGGISMHEMLIPVIHLKPKSLVI
ncbi:MAG: PglZ domain-containing protein [Bacteroidetes bacterium]|nr:PglZ domain-containing protein [Bacteroidota bacterium]MBU1578815.1 PglZ domain-containing protein [Bacteroidota bacterium]MBU2466121.1 PglZ domain-containing protein [Bacteroidota bacterium]MBU2557319.1 PglZ domain-containing protein [Bacteroidota bacterium]